MRNLCGYMSDGRVNYPTRMDHDGKHWLAFAWDTDGHQCKGRNDLACAS
jgi:hypothetical protein